MVISRSAYLEIKRAWVRTFLLFGLEAGPINTHLTSKTSHSQPILTVYVVWHPGFKRAVDFISTIYTYLSGQPDFPASRPIGIRVRFRTGVDGKVPPLIPFGSSRHNAVFILADNSLLADESWREYVEKTVDSVRLTVDRIIPVAIIDPRYLPSKLRAYQAIRLNDISEGSQKNTLLIAMLHDLCRLLDPSHAKVQVFLSHAKHDGVQIASNVRQYLQTVARLDGFFDALDIPDGEPFAEFLIHNVARLPVVLAIETDSYASRDWCRLEVLEAKRHQVPVVVLSAIREGGGRSFPYMGNVPVVRCDEGPERLEILARALLGEVLRHRYFPKTVELLAATKSVRTVWARPPELVTVVAERMDGTTAPTISAHSASRYLLYPDPPLGTDELQLLHALDPHLIPVTPTTLEASTATEASWQQAAVAVSVSEPSHEELVGLGLGEVHVRQGFIELVRHILARGGTIAYGGDLRRSGYTDALFDLLRTYNPNEAPTAERVLAYLAWPIWLDTTAQQFTEILNLATVEKVPAPTNAPQRLGSIADRTPTELAWNSAALTKMREAMSERMTARIVLGGRTYGQQGLYPGVIEEAALTLQLKKPLYVAGGFGGCGRVVALALQGEKPESLTIDYQRTHTPRYAELILAASSAPSIETLLDTFRAVGVAGLCNGLTEDENLLLFTTDDIDRLVSLVLLGLDRVLSREP